MVNKTRMKKVLFIGLSGLLVCSLKAQTKKPEKKPVATLSKSTLQSSINRGKIVYATNCLACHQADGSGVPNMNPPVVQTSWVLGSKTVLIQQILKGSNGKVEIEGDKFHNTMPPQPHLTDQQIADVLTYVRNSFGNKASIVTPAEVKVVRSKTK
jgi:mono/diheme cytochrome c family protein